MIILLTRFSNDSALGGAKILKILKNYIIGHQEILDTAMPGLTQDGAKSNSENYNNVSEGMKIARLRNLSKIQAIS